MPSFLRRAADAVTARRERGPRERHALVGPADLWRMKRDFQIAFLKERGLRPDDYLLDIGCGTLRGGIPLIGYLKAGHYYGTDVRPDVLEEGRAELREHKLEGKRPVLIAGTFGDIDLDRQFTFIWAFSVLIHLTDPILDECLAFVAAHLDGDFYANVFIGEKPDTSWQGFPVVTRRLEFYETVAARHGLRFVDLGELRDLGHTSGVKRQDRQHLLRGMCSN